MDLMNACPGELFQNSFEQSGRQIYQKSWTKLLTRSEQCETSFDEEYSDDQSADRKVLTVRSCWRYKHRLIVFIAGIALRKNGESAVYPAVA